MLSQQIQVFLKVAESGSLSKAAEALYVTPASIMRQMNLLENRLGLKLLTRTNHGIRLTASGEHVYQAAKHLAAEAEATLHQARAIEQREAKTIRIGSSFLRPGNVLIDLWNRVAPAPNAYRFKLIPYDDDREQILSVIDSLGSRMDFMVGSLNAQQMIERASYLELGDYHICVALPRSHPLASHALLQPEDLHGERLIVIPSGVTAELDAIRHWLENNHPQITIEDTDRFYDINTFNHCEETGALLLTFDAWASVHPSLVTVPVNWSFTAPYGLLYSPSITGEAAEFLRILQKALKK